MVPYRRPWQRQPHRLVPVNRSLGLRPVSVNLFSASLLVDAVGGGRWQQQLTPDVVPTRYGLAAGFGGSSENNALYRDDIPHLPEFSWFTRVYLGGNKDTALYGLAAKHGANGFGSDWTIYRNSSQQFVVDWPWIVNVLTTAASWADLQWVDIGLTRRLSAGTWTADLYVNGLLVGTGSTATAPGTSSYLYQLGSIGAVTGNNYCDNRYAYAALFEGVASAGFARRMAINPWGELFEPERGLIPSASLAPTLLTASAINLTSTSFRPRVTFTR